MRIFDCVVLSQWGEMGLLERRFQAYKDNPDVIHVICEVAPGVFKDGDRVSDLAEQWHGRWNHVLVREDEITGDRDACLREFLLHGFHGEPDDLIQFSGIRDIPGEPGGVPRGSIVRMADLAGA